MRTVKTGTIVIGTTSKNFSEMIMKAIKKYCDYTIVVAHNDGDFKSAVEINRPYLIFVDSCAWQIATPHMIETFKMKYPKTIIAVFSFEAITLKDAVLMIERGACGMVNIRFDEYAISRGIKTLVGGHGYIPPEVEEARDRYAIVYDAKVLFTPREQQVYELLLQIKTSADIADRLHIAVYTVINHRHNIYRKCGVRSIPELILFALNRGDYVLRDAMSAIVRLNKEGRIENRE
jgi:DNA-binding NarL/FixJ family response regulator